MSFRAGLITNAPPPTPPPKNNRGDLSVGVEEFTRCENRMSRKFRFARFFLAESNQNIFLFSFFKFLYFDQKWFFVSLSSVCKESSRCFLFSFADFSAVYRSAFAEIFPRSQPMRQSNTETQLVSPLLIFPPSTHRFSLITPS
jgi:hypothetical protein